MSDRVTNEQLYRALMGIQKSIDEKLEKMHSRIDALEEFKFRVSFGFGIVLFVITFAKDYILEKVGIKA